MVEDVEKARGCRNLFKNKLGQPLS